MYRFATFRHSLNAEMRQASNEGIDNKCKGLIHTCRKNREFSPSHVCE